MTRFALVSALALLALAFASPVAAAPPAVPSQTSYQGVLLDTAGEPRSGNVDLTLRIWDALDGGTLVYTQQFSNVPLVDGVFTVKLGPTGEATDAPDDPLTTSLATALGGDAGATAPERFLEVTVGSEGALLRSQILASPYALRAGSADSAATAAVADNVTAVNGLDAAVLNQLYTFGNTDGSGPPNTHPDEGTVDTDGDGAMNFIDPDNDDDGIPDGQEESDGSSLNVVTPTLTSLSPTTVLGFAPAAVTLTGLHFDPTMTVFVREAPVPASGVTATSATIQPPPGPAGPAAVYVQLTNGERSLDRLLTFQSNPTPGIPLSFPAGSTVSVSVRGTAKLVVANDESYAVDQQEDGTVDQLVPFDQLANPPSGTPSQIAVAWGSDGRLLGIRCVANASGCQIQVIRDADEDLVLSDAGGDDVLLGPSYTGTALRLWGPSVTSDPSGHIVAGYVLVDDAGAGQPTVLHDRDGNGSFSASPPETVVIENVASVPGNFGKLAVDPAGRVAYGYLSGAGNVFRVGYDRNGDGDYADVVGGNPETFSAYNVAVSASSFCGGLAFDASGRLAGLYSIGLFVPRVLRDLNGDGDFADVADVNAPVGVNANSGCDIAGHATGGLAVVHSGAAGGSPLQLLVDRNDDGDFADTNEAVPLGSLGARVGVTFSGSGRAWVAGGTGVFTDPF